MLKLLFGLAIVLAGSSDVEVSADIAAAIYGRPEYSKILKKICYRESRCLPIGEHAIDSRYHRRLSSVASKKYGWLKSCQSNYLNSYWSTSGPYGLMRAYHFKYFGERCIDPRWMDYPLVAAILAMEKLSRSCGRRCTYASSKRAWGRSLQKLGRPTFVPYLLSHLLAMCQLLGIYPRR